MSEIKQEPLWYVARDGKQLGPYSRQDLDRLYVSNRIAPDDMLWCERITEWTPVERVLGAPKARPLPPPPPQAAFAPPPRREARPAQSKGTADLSPTGSPSGSLAVGSKIGRPVLALAAVVAAGLPIYMLLQSRPAERANESLVATSQIVQKAEGETSPVERYRLLMSAKATLDDIVQTYAETPAAVRIVSNEKLGRWTRTELEAEVIKAANHPEVCFAAPSKQCLTSAIVSRAKEQFGRPSDPRSAELSRMTVGAAWTYFSLAGAPEAKQIMNDYTLHVSKSDRSVLPRAVLREQMLSPYAMATVIADMTATQGVEKTVAALRTPSFPADAITLDALAHAFANTFGVSGLQPTTAVLKAVKPNITSKELAQALKGFIGNLPQLSEVDIGELIKAWPADQYGIFTEQINLGESKPGWKTYERLLEAAQGDSDRKKVIDNIVRAWIPDLPFEPKYSFFKQSEHVNDPGWLRTMYLTATEKGYGDIRRELIQRISAIPDEKVHPNDVEAASFRRKFYEASASGELATRLPELIDASVVKKSGQPLAIHNCRELSKFAKVEARAPVSALLDACVKVLDAKSPSTPDTVYTLAHLALSRDLSTAQSFFAALPPYARREVRSQHFIELLEKMGATELVKALEHEDAAGERHLVRWRIGQLVKTDPEAAYQRLAQQNENAQRAIVFDQMRANRSGDAAAQAFIAKLIAEKPDIVLKARGDWRLIESGRKGAGLLPQGTMRRLCATVEDEVCRELVYDELGFEVREAVRSGDVAKLLALAKEPSMLPLNWVSAVGAAAIRIQQ